MSSNLPKPNPDALEHSLKLCADIHQDIAAQGGWIPFSRFMELALYAPNLGYYTAGARKFGAAGDFITAPELSPLFGRSLARQVADIMAASTRQIIELGAGSGKLAVTVLTELARLNALPEKYFILEVSADLRQRQQEMVRNALPEIAERVQWLAVLPEKIQGALIANEVLDALPVHLVRWSQNGIFERGVISHDQQFAWQERLPENPTLLNLAQKIPANDDYLSEISPAANGLISSLSERLECGAMLLIDYGFGAREYYHPQRSNGTLMCHYRHHAHDQPFYLPGLQDITAHVNFTAVAEAAIDAGAHLYGYTSQAFFLMNCGILDLLQEVSPDNLREYLPLSAQVQKLTSAAEMGELFKVIALGKGLDAPLRGFTRGSLSRLL